jgi:hypothetical protein
VDAVLLEPGAHRTVAFNSATWSEGAIKKDGEEYECPKNVPESRRHLDFMHGTRMRGLEQEFDKFDILWRMGQMTAPTHLL